MSAGQELVQCSNPECRVQETGRCIEGLSLSECAHYGKSIIDTSASNGPDENIITDDSDTVTTVSESIRLPPADYLGTAEASHVLRSGDARVLAVIGPSDSGKTSLIASTYELFQESHSFGVGFANSLTLHAFERACHDAREASRRTEPHSERTKHGRVQFYHLEVAVGLGRLLSLLFADRAGEEYRSAADNQEIVRGFSEIARADSISILVDGERLVDTRARHALRSEAILVIQALIESGVLTKRVPLAVILTKLDVVRNTGSAESEEFFQSIIEKLRDIGNACFSEITPFLVAASPRTTALKRGHGVHELLEFWVNSIPVQDYPTDITLPSERPERAFLQLRELAE